MGSTENGNYPNDASGHSVGFLTGSIASISGSDEQICTTYYYNRKGQVIKTVQNNLLEGYDVTETAYSFTGNPITVTRTHTASGKVSRTETLTYTYDHSDRLSTVKHQLGSGSAVTLASYTYDTLGRVVSKKLHGSSDNQMSYAYNIRDWLTEVSSNKFTQSLIYNNGTAGFNGNITAMAWMANGESHGYSFGYDGADRLLEAVHGNNHFTEKVTSYDKNGNIKGLQRYGQLSSSTYGLVDDLTFTLNGNLLAQVEDAVTSTSYTGGTNFINGSNSAEEYAYDKNGNLTKDLNKNITNISYNYLNLPLTVNFTDGSMISYLYSADGKKLRTTHVINGITTQTDYCGNVLYENGVQKRMITEEGYIDLTVSTPTYYYYLKDHRGNNRVVINSSGTVQETNHYYPFGGLFANNSSIQPYKYNGKEFDSKMGLNWYDYGARQYDATLGRWHVVDPMADHTYPISPFTYCDNNPCNRIDQTGMYTNPIYDKEGHLLGTDDKGLQGEAFIMDEYNFKQGMPHDDAKKNNLGLTGLKDQKAKDKFEASYNTLKDRPDWDGYLTKKEADNWWLGKSGEPLFVDQSKIELHGVNTSSFIQKNPIYKNFIWGLTNTGKVYGTLKMTLIDSNTGKVFIGDKYLDEYDFNMDGRLFRDFATWIGRPGSKNAGKS